MRSLVTKQQYFHAALGELASSGFKALNIGVMCRALGVTSGSFYHHFGNWDTFVAELLEHWERTAIEALEARQFGGGDPGDDIAALRELTLSLNHAAEAAIRSWAGNNHGVRDAVERVDHNRIRTVQRAISRTISDTRKAEVMTSLGMDMLVGHQLRGGADDMDRFSAVLDEFLTLVYSHRTQQAS